MKKLLLASAVLVGMGANLQAFAANTDAFTADIDISIGETCVIDDTMTVTTTVGSVNKTSDVIHGITGIAAAGFDEDFDLTLTIGGQSFCNYPHFMEVVSQYGGGFASQEDIDAAGTADSTSDDFKVALPYKMDILGWGTEITSEVKWAQPAIGTIAAFDTAAFVSEGDVNTAETGGNALTVENSTVNLAFHNSGASSTAGATANAGLAIKLTHTVPSGTESTPMLSGDYTDRIFLKVASSL